MAAYGALVSLMHIMENLELRPSPPLSLHKEQVASLTQKITFLQEFLEDYNPQLGYTTEADPLEARIAAAAHAAEDLIESHIVDRMVQISNDGEKVSSGSLYASLEKVIEKMASIAEEAMAVKHQLRMKPTPSDSLRSHSSIAHKSSMVGVADVLLELKDKLTSHYHDLLIIPIVGMGGTGKTTLVTNIYQDRYIKEYFDVCAWTTITQEFRIRDFLIEVLPQLNLEVDQHLSDDELGVELYKHLYGRKYLIIMDDMWSIDAWYRVRNFFPNNNNGSRIVVTTRLSNLAYELSCSGSLEMRLLDKAYSWDLLSQTVFGGESCPLELEKIGKRIAKGCNGLPLSIVVVGGLLAKSKHTRETWEHIEENINSVVNLEDDKRCLKILYLSYKQLPVHLKPCFLYMGFFSKDLIRVSRLIKLWVAEGFLKPINGKSLEEAARVYVKELTDRNLVLIHKMGCTGNIKECKLHDLLRDLCLREAKKERFYTVVSRNLSPQWIRYAAQRRILVSSYKAINSLKYSRSLARSLIWDLEYQALQPYSCKLLRILESRGMQSRRRQSPARAEFLNFVSQLINSRFLEISSISSGCKFPSSIWLFWNLQTLIVGHTWEVTAPVDIWYMPHIRHVEFHSLDFHHPPTARDDNSVLTNLQTLGIMKYFECSEQVVKRMPNIKKLQIFYEGFHDKYCLRNLRSMDKLESLKCQVIEARRGSLNTLIDFPHSLKKLILSINRSQCWQEILEKIGVLPHLQKLQLEVGTFEEGKWETSEGQFPSLRFLLIRECLGLRFWKSESSHFPCLEHLVLDRTGNLREIPSDFAEIPTLCRIDLEYCRVSTVESAKRILEEREELYGEEGAFQVQARLSDSKKDIVERLAGPNMRFEWTQGQFQSLKLLT